MSELDDFLRELEEKPVEDDSGYLEPEADSVGSEAVGSSTVLEMDDWGYRMGWETLKWSGGFRNDCESIDKANIEGVAADFYC